MANDTGVPIFPPDVQCFAVTNYNEGFDLSSFVRNNCTVSQNMVNYLNLTQEIGKYVAAYCTNPPGNDDCPFDFCPNPDIAGMDLTIHQFSLLADWILHTQARWYGSQVSACRIPVSRLPNSLRLNRLRHGFLYWYVEHHSRSSGQTSIDLIHTSRAYFLFAQEGRRSILLPGPYHIFPADYMSRRHRPT